MKKITFLAMFVIMSYMVNAQISRFVKVDGTGDGTSWANAAGNADIQTMVDVVAADANKGTVYFAAGTYMPGATIAIKNGVNMSGGYNIDGSGSRDLLINETILDGQFNKRILFSTDANTTPAFTKIATIDGFIIQRGSGSYGSAIFMTLGVVLQNCIIRNNNGSTYGAAIMMKRTQSLTTAQDGGKFSGALINCLIINNTSSDRAAGIYVDADAHFSLANCVIANNKSTDATNGVGGLLIGNNIRYSRMTNNIFYNNSSPVTGKNNFYSGTTNYAAVWANYFSDATIPVGLDVVVTGASPAHGNKTATDISSPGFEGPTTFQGYAGADVPKTAELTSSNWRLKSTSGLIGLGANPTTRGDLPYPFLAIAFGSTAKLYSSVSSDIMGSNRVIGTIPEMGAYEYSPVVVTANSADIALGTVAGGTTVSKGSSVTLSTTPASGYKILKWNDGTSDVSTLGSYSFIPTVDVTVTASFIIDSSTGFNQGAENALITLEGRNLNFHGLTAMVEVYNSVGALVVSQKVSNTTIQLKAAGVYLVKIVTLQGIKIQKVLVK